MPIQIKDSIYHIDIEFVSVFIGLGINNASNIEFKKMPGSIGIFRQLLPGSVQVPENQRRGL